MTEYWAALNISRTEALDVLKELATQGSQLRKDLHKSKRSAQAALAAHNIYFASASLPDRIRLPEPGDVAQVRAAARALVAKDRRPFGWWILAVVFSAMPVVDCADTPGREV
jgi:hypothetical protein